MTEKEEPRNLENNSKFLVLVEVTVRGDIVEWFRELYKKCQEDKTFYKSYINNPRKALLTELSRDVWHPVPMDEFEPKFEAALPKKGEYKIEIMRGPLDPKHLLELAEKISKDEKFAEAFRKDPVGIISEMRVPNKIFGCEIYASHSQNCNSEVGARCGLKW
jgi:hypothetical protein